MKRRDAWTLALATIALTVAASSWAQEDQAAELAKKLSNPVASLISVPIQYNRDEYGRANDGASATRLVFQPVVPFSLNEDWNLITRTIIPVVDQKDFPVPALNESGLSDITTSLFFSPKSPTAGGLIWGAGPVFLLPTATQDVLGPGRARHREVGSRADGCGAEAIRAVDGGRARQPPLVRRR